MVPENFTNFITELTSQVKGGLISMTRINDAVRRILTVKFTMGLFEYPMADPSLANHLGSKVKCVLFFVHWQFLRMNG